MLDFAIRPVLVALHLHGRNHLGVLVLDAVHEQVDGEIQRFLQCLVVFLERLLEFLDFFESIIDLLEREILVFGPHQELVAFL